MRGAVFGDDVKAALAHREPDLNLAQTSGLASPGREVEILLAIEATGL